MTLLDSELEFETAASETKKLFIDDIVIDVDAGEVFVSGLSVDITGKEYLLLQLLAEHAGETVTRGLILERLYRDEDEAEMKIIDVFVCRLKKKLADASTTPAFPQGKKYIATVWGRGYMVGEPKVAIQDIVPERGRPKYVHMLGGTHLKFEELPPAGTRRWVIRRKAEVLSAVKDGMLTVDEVAMRYGVGQDELQLWGRQIRGHGLAGLRTTRFQQYRLT